MVHVKIEDAIKYEPNYRLVKNGIRDLGKKTQKNTEKKAKKIRGVMPRKKNIVEPLLSSYI